MKKEEKAVLEFLRGKNKTEIAKKLEVTRQRTLHMIKAISKVNSPKAKALTHEQLNNVEGLRQILNISIAEVARKMDMSETTLADYIYRRKKVKSNPNWYVPYAKVVLSKASQKIKVIAERVEGVWEV